MATALTTLLRHTNQPPGEKARRLVISQHVVRHAVKQVAQINRLANMLMSLYVLDLVESGEPVPLMLSETNGKVWRWCVSLVSKLGDKWTGDIGPEEEEEGEENADEQGRTEKEEKQPADEEARRRQQQSKLIQQRKLHERRAEEEVKVALRLKHVLDKPCERGSCRSTSRGPTKMDSPTL